MIDFQQLLKALVERKVEFIIVGGVAATIHGSAKLTQDFDIVYQRTPANFERLVAAIEPYKPYLRGAPPGLPFTWDSRTLESGLNFTLTTTVGDIDLLGEIIGGGNYDKLLSDCVTVRVFQCEVRCLGLERLIYVKRAAGRPKDIEAIAELEAILDESQGNPEATG